MIKQILIVWLVTMVAASRARADECHPVSPTDDVCARAQSLQQALAKDLPQKMTSSLTATGVVTTGRIATIFATADIDKKSWDATNGSINMDDLTQKSQVFAQNSVCGETGLSDFIRRGGILGYEYKFNDGSPFERFQVDKCN